MPSDGPAKPVEPVELVLSGEMTIIEQEMRVHYSDIICINGHRLDILIGEALGRGVAGPARERLAGKVGRCTLHLKIWPTDGNDDHGDNRPG